MKPEHVWHKEVKLLRSFIIKVQQGEYIVEKLREKLRELNVGHAVIISAVGSVSDVTFRGIKTGAKLPITSPRTTVHKLEGPLELLGLTGNLFPSDNGETDFHLHILLSKSSGEVVGGHLFNAKVFASCEIMISELHTDGIERHYSKTGGTPTIFIEDK